VITCAGSLSTSCDYFASGYAVHSKDRDNGWVITIVRPFMTRVHERVHERVQHADVKLHIDGKCNDTSDTDKKLVWLMCGMFLGGMPLGVSVTNGNSAAR
jgi:hypothetical protein